MIVRREKRPKVDRDIRLTPADEELTVENLTARIEEMEETVRALKMTRLRIGARERMRKLHANPEIMARARRNSIKTVMATPEYMAQRAARLRESMAKRGVLLPPMTKKQYQTYRYSRWVRGMNREEALALALSDKPEVRTEWKTKLPPMSKEQRKLYEKLKRGLGRPAAIQEALR